MSDTTPYSLPKEPGRWRAILLAALVHVALFALLWFGVRWQNETPTAEEAEIWSPQVREAAPRPQPEPEPEPVKQPEPQPVIKPIPKPVEVEPPPDPKPDIALEQEKKRLAKAQKAHEEEMRLEKKRAEEKRIEREKIDAAAKKKLAAEDARKEAAEKKRKQDAEEEQRLAKARDEEMRRITGGVTGTGGSGDAPKSQGSRADASYAQKLMARIKSNTVFNVPDNVPGESAVEYVVELLPDGSLRGLRKLKSSGIAGFDEAVKRAIEKSAPYPPDKSGTVPSSLNVVHKPKDQ